MGRARERLSVVDADPAERALWEEYERLECLPNEQLMRAFVQLPVRPRVELPPPPGGRCFGEPPPLLPLLLRRRVRVVEVHVGRGI
jgi:hypothetical protein